MGRTTAGLSAICAAAIVALGCGGSSGAAPGSERGACFPNATCDQGLTCLSNFCVRVDVDGASGASGSAGAGGNAAGAGGVAGAGGTGGSSGGAATGGSTGGTFAPASHAPLPQLANLGGPVLATPKVRPIFFTGDPDQADISAFLSELAAGSYWAATTSEYGVGTLKLLPPVTGAGVTGPTLSDGALQAALAANASSASAPWGAADASTIFLFVLPPGVGITSGGAACCTDFGGYHDEAIVNGAAVPYAVVCTCPDFFGAGWTEVDERTVAMSHELVEAATDPFPRSDPAFYAADTANLVWTLVTGGEVADMCVVQPDTFIIPSGATHVFQRSWSNAAAKLGRDPCVPASSPPYFAAMPVLDVIPYGTAGYKTHGLQIPIGSSRTIDLDLFSTGPVANGWNVGAYSYEDLLGGAPSLAFSLDKTTGRNGDILRLTITAVRTNPTIGVDPFIIVSSTGSPGGSDYRSHVTMGLVTN